MSVDLYERYKNALRRGHAAIARGQLDVALAAYREALSLAPDRALPHAGVGQVLLRQGQAAEAVAAFDAALARSPRDETGLRGRAEALARLGRRTDAAEAFDVLSDVQEAAGRLGDACDTTRRALDLAEQKARRRRFQDLTRRLRLQAGDQEAHVALARSLRPLAVTDLPRPAPPGPAAAETAPAEPEPSRGEPPAELEPAEPVRADPERGPGGEDRLEAVREVAPEVASQPGGVARPAEAATPADVRPPDEPASLAESASAAEAVTAPAPRPDPSALMRAAEAALDAGDTAAARQAYLDAAAEYQVEGRLAAALDACSAVLAFAPDDAAVHLRLVELYIEQGWYTPAADKLALLGRLTELDDRQGDARARIVVLAADHFPDDPRLRRLSAPRTVGR